MAASGSFAKKFASYYSLLVEWSESNVNVAACTSDLTVTVKLQAGGGYIESTAGKSISLTVNGTAYSGTCTIGISKNETKVLFTKTVTGLAHNGTTGELTVDLSCTLGLRATLGGTYYSNVTASGTAELSRILRLSTLTAANGTLGTAQSLQVVRQNSGFTHTISYTCGTASGTICTNSGSTQVSFTPPISLAAQNPAGDSVTVTLKIKTLQAGQLLGEWDTVISCAIPSSVKPTCTLTLADAAGYFESYGVYIQGLSRLQVTVGSTPAQGAAVIGCQTQVGEDVYSGTSFTTDTLRQKGTVIVRAEVTDQRGRPGTAQKSITVAEYVAPTVSALTAIRCTANGTADPQGAYCKLTFSTKAYNVASQNTATYVVRYKKTTAAAYTAVTLSAMANVFTASNQTYVFAAEPDSSYDIVLELTDQFGTGQRSARLSTAFVLTHFDVNNGAVGFGKRAERDNAVEFGLPVYVDSAIRGGGGKLLLDDDSICLSLTGTCQLGSYRCTVFPLCKLSTTANTALESGTLGTFYFRRSNGATEPKFLTICAINDYTNAYRFSISAYGTVTYNSGMTVSAGFGFRTCRFQLDGVWYGGILFILNNAEYNRVYFVGVGSNNPVRGIDVYHRNNGTVLNAEIYNSIGYDYGVFSGDLGFNGKNTNPYPVGSIYIAYNHTSPASLFGGTWTRITGRFLWGAGASETIGATSGEVSHTLTADELPSHRHELNSVGITRSTSSNAVEAARSAALSNLFDNTHYTAYTGGGAAHNNMPPYINVSIWRRTA